MQEIIKLFSTQLKTEASKQEIKETNESKNSSVLEFKGQTGAAELDEFIKVRLQFSTAAHDMWTKAVLYKLNKESKNSLLHHGALPFFQKYLKHISQFKQGDWWKNWEPSIIEKIMHYTYDQAAINASKAFSNATKERNENESKSQATLLDYILERSLKFLTESSFVRQILGEETVTSRESMLIRNKNNIKNFLDNNLLQSNDIAEQIAKLQSREAKMQTALPLLFKKIHETKTKWQPYGYYPFLRGALLANVAVILSDLLSDIEKHIQSNSGFVIQLAGLGITKNQLTQSIQLKDNFKNELAKIAEVMLWQEEIFYETKGITGDVDLVVAFLKSLQNTISEFDINDHSFDCFDQYWGQCDKDIRQLFKMNAEAEDKAKEAKEKLSPFWCFHNTLPSDITPKGVSQFRQEFVIKYGNETTKEAMQKIIYKESDLAKASNIAKLLSKDKSLQNNCSENIKSIFKKFFGFQWWNLERLLKMHDFLAIDLLSEDGFPFIGNEKGIFATFQKQFPAETKKQDILCVIKAELNVLRLVLVNPIDKKNWLALLTQAKIEGHSEFGHLIKTVLDPLQDLLAIQSKLDEAQAALSSKDRLRILIKEHLQEEYKSIEIKQFIATEKNLPTVFSHRAELIALHTVYHHPDDEKYWQTMFNPQFFNNRNNQRLLNMLNRLIHFVEDQRLFDACRKLYATCHKQYYNSILTEHAQRSSMLHSIYSKIICKNGKIRMTQSDYLMEERTSYLHADIQTLLDADESLDEENAQQEVLFTKMRKIN